ncbi:hypothetical protein [Streptomyces glomeratus]|uniref:Integral membrane protein n=1 Tax=Streptomyces glomeratus TaxID=284452 RepID=A0ABP6M0E6_9ACTN|nr:hypothetical protein [Streptomyces glomeratus]MCF1506333.1 hypothetical protein [Streptomyces glomeratus]
MYGHGAAPPTRSSGTVITLRVLFPIAGFLSCGLLACLPLFRVALLRGRGVDWLLAWVSMPVSIGCLAVVGSVPEGDHRSDIALATVLLLGAVSGAYFVVFDIRHHRALPPTGPTPPGPPAYAPPGYAYPAVQPYTPPAQTPPPPYTPAPPPRQPQRPAPARIDQVRAELDELSDYLRRHEDGR